MAGTYRLLATKQVLEQIFLVSLWQWNYEIFRCSGLMQKMQKQN